MSKLKGGKNPAEEGKENICPECEGIGGGYFKDTGHTEWVSVCSVCKGTGKVPVEGVEKIKSNDFSKGWINDERKRQVALRDKLCERYQLFKDQETTYAKGIKRMLDVRNKIIELLKSEKES